MEPTNALYTILKHFEDIKALNPGGASLNLHDLEVKEVLALPEDWNVERKNIGDRFYFVARNKTTDVTLFSKNID